METIILIAAGIFVLLILYFKARRLVDTVKGNPVKSSCDCGDCSESCPAREYQSKNCDSKQK